MSGTSIGGSSQHIVGTTTMPSKTDPRRATLIKLIHVARRDLGMDEPTYRTVLLSAGKSESLSGMSVSNMQAVLERLKKDGFKVRPKASSRPLATAPEASKVRALWLFLYELGEVRDPSEKALVAYVSRIAKVDDLRWSHGSRQVNAEFKDRSELLIETLKKWAMRILPGKVMELLAQAKTIALAPAEVEQINADLARAFGTNTFDPMHAAWETLNSTIKKER